MKAIKEIDNELFCFGENAIIYNDNSFREISGNYKLGYETSNLKFYKEINKLGYTNLTNTIELSHKNFKIISGETSWGGEGFISVKEINSNKILWIIILTTMNNPVSINIEEDIVTLKTDLNYPSGVNFIIPINNPEKFKTEIIEEKK